MAVQLKHDIRGYHAGNISKRYLREAEAADEFELSSNEVIAYATAAGALYRLPRTSLIHRERMETFMKHLYKIPISGKVIEKKYVRLGEASVIYSIGRHRMIEMARAAGAVYKLGDGASGKLSVIDADGKLVESWISEVGKTHMIERLPVGKYTLREESAPYGYKVASDVTFEVKETAEIQKVSMKDEQVVGKIVIEKTDKVTGKLIEGVVFEVRDKDGKVLDILTTDKNGHAESKELPICTYNEDGTFKEDIHYTVVETKAADGYILDETAHDVTLRYDDNAPDVVVATLKLP